MFGKYDENTEDNDRSAVMLIKLPVDYKEKLYEIIVCIFDTITDYFINYGFWSEGLRPSTTNSEGGKATGEVYYTDHLVIYNNETLVFVEPNYLSCYNVDLLKVTEKSSQNMIDDWSEFQDNPVIIRGEIVNNEKLELCYDYPVVSICASKYYYEKTRGAKNPSEYFVEDRYFE
jgi:hypothetical protein